MVCILDIKIRYTLNSPQLKPVIGNTENSTRYGQSYCMLGTIQHQNLKTYLNLVQKQ